MPSFTGISFLGIAVALFFLCCPIWVGAIAGWVASRLMPKLNRFDCVISGFAVGFLINCTIFGVGLAILIEDLSTPVRFRDIAFFYAPSVSAVLTLGICWWMNRVKSSM